MRNDPSDTNSNDLRPQWDLVDEGSPWRALAQRAARRFHKVRKEFDYTRLHVVDTEEDLFQEALILAATKADVRREIEAGNEAGVVVKLADDLSNLYDAAIRAEGRRQGGYVLPVDSYEGLLEVAGSLVDEVENPLDTRGASSGGTSAEPLVGDSLRYSSAAILALLEIGLASDQRHMVSRDYAGVAAGVVDVQRAFSEGSLTVAERRALFGGLLGSKQSVANRLGVSRQYVSQLSRSALDKMEEWLSGDSGVVLAAAA